jgi:hypothetical protein
MGDGTGRPWPEPQSAVYGGPEERPQQIRSSFAIFRRAAALFKGGYDKWVTKDAPQVQDTRRR